MPLEGLQIGRYRFIRRLGSGGMGEVYLAEDARIGQQVAIKVIQSAASPYPDADASTRVTRLFQREATAIARLDHPHILPLFDYGEASLADTTLNYLVMPFRREGSLLDWLGRRKSSALLSPQNVAQIVSQTADALQHSHDQQIIHQDVKPSNLLIRELKETPDRPDVQLADFGIAKFTTAATATSQVIRGTPTYMAPEQWAGHPVPASDQYSLAIMAYELLTGRPPFQGSSMQLMYQHLSVQPQAPSTFNAALSAEVDTVLLQALAKEPAQRFASMAAFAQAFRLAVQGAEMGHPLQMARSSGSLSAAHEDEIHAVLAISENEARHGTLRALTLPGGRRVTIAVPAGIQDGHMVRLDSQGEEAEQGSLMLIIEVKQAQENLTAPNAALTEPTMPLSSAPDQASSPPEASQTVKATGASTPRDVPSQPGLAAQANAPTLRNTPAIIAAREGRATGQPRRAWRWLLPTATALVALLLLAGGMALAVPGEFAALVNGMWTGPAQVAPSPAHATPVHATPKSFHPTPTAKAVPTSAPSPAPSPTPSPTSAPSPAPSPTPSPTSAPSPAPSPTPSPTSAPSPAPSPTPSPTSAPRPSPTPSPTSAPRPSPTPSPTSAPRPSPTPSPTSAPSPAPSPTPSPTSAPTPAPTSTTTPSSPTP